MTRPLTATEKSDFRASFPRLDVDRAVVSGEATTAYNCIAWTAGVTNRWVWPGDTLAEFDTYYRSIGFTRSGDGPIAVWGVASSNMKHGCISGPGHGPRWESKCGANLRIQHGLDELTSSSYGHVIAFYRRTADVRPLAPDIAGILQNALFPAAFGEASTKTRKRGSKMKDKKDKALLSAAQLKRLRGEANELPGELRTVFEQAFAAWKDTWFRGGLAISSSPRDRAVGQEFDALIALGPEVLPLVVQELADPENFMALQLYDALQASAPCRVHVAPDDQRIHEGEQGRALRTVQAWMTNR